MWTFSLSACVTLQSAFWMQQLDFQRAAERVILVKRELHEIESEGNVK